MATDQDTVATVIRNSLNIMENIAQTLKKTEINLKKCPKVRLTRSYMEARLKCIEEYWSEFKQAHHNIILSATKSEKEKLPYLVNNEFSEYEELYITLKSDILEFLSKIETSSTPIPTQQISHSDSQTVRVALPKIQLPTYSGGYEEWLSFHDLFTTLVHDNKSLNNVQRLHYLKTTLTGEAAMLLRHIQITDANYIQAWDLLKSRYGNKRITINAILTRFFSQRKITTQTSHQLKGLLDTTFECIHQLKNLEVSTENWDPVIIFVIVQKLDSDTHKEWEQYVSDTDSDSLPTIDMFKKFLENRYRTLELSEPVRYKANPTSVKERSFHIATAVDTVHKCQMCNENHTISHCKDFSKLTPHQRSEVVKARNLCFNCLSTGHSFKNCRMPLNCKICKRRHHTLLHVKYNDFKDTSGQPDHFKQPEATLHANVEESEDEIARDITLSASHATTKYSTGLLATAIVHVRSEYKYTTIVRALIDQGSQASFISERAAQALVVKRYAVRGTVVGVGSCTEEIKQFAYIEVLSKCGQFSYNVKVYIISKQLTTKLPSCKINKNDWHHLEGLVLADANYCEPGAVDLLLGVDVYAQIIENELVKGPPGSPCAQRTSLGWILFGRIEDEYEKPESVVVMHHQIETEDFLKTLWEIDQDTKRKYTKEEELCENYYEKTYKRDNNGRYIVALPFRSTGEPQSLRGNTREIAMQRLIQHERKMFRTPDLHEQYNSVLDEYLSMGHMEEVPVNEIEKPSVYLPHHAVIKNDKETTKLRVVFDGSCKGYNGVSLNDELMIGPVIQEDLRSIIMRWRMHRVCFISDITKMYRMIRLREQDQDYHRILWRRSKSNEIKHHRLQTVTFGTSAAPYLAIKTLTKLAESEGKSYPAAAKVIHEDFYVDDLMSGCDTVEEAIQISNEIQIVMSAGGFELQKWASNDTKFLKAMDPAKVTTKADFNLKLDGVIKALGVSWNFGEDQLQYQLHLEPTAMPITKRTILSDVQKLFDPLGWIAPTIVTAKILMQRLWLEGVGWDEELSQELQDEWQSIRDDLQNVHKIKINRWLNTVNVEKDKITLHGFCDASEKAYAAVVYCRVQHAPDEIKTHIVAARTKVAPVKTVSLPRLELNGAVLLAHLIHKASQAMKIPAHKMFAWTDSTIVLSWLFGEPNRWKPFVANRVVEILEHVRNTNWFHVQSAHNPADIASRGSSLSDLQCNRLWWNGPGWLTEEHIFFSKPQIQPVDIERKVIHSYVNIAETNQGISLEEYDTLTELLRVIVHCKRFINSKKYPEKLNQSISTEELYEALKFCIQRVQEEDFSEDIYRLKNNNTVKSTSNIKSLNPFLDSHGVLRVGGRLRKSEQEENMKHPIILSKKNTLVQLILKDAHKRTMHGGIQMMMAYILSEYWIIGCKNLVKQYTRKCLTCARQRAVNRHQIMGDLPKARVTPARPFSCSGVDFAGPVQVLNSKGRGARTKKAYICIFICMAVKAVHLELVSDMTAEAFIAAFRRFVARRGRCVEIWSDNGLNFVAANKELSRLWKASKFNLPDLTAEQLANDGTQWHFIPPYTPNFGGLWEAGVKSIKYHLRRTLTTNLTFEEFATVLTQIEACLNSRPLVPVSTTVDLIDDIQVLTPGHFIIGEPLVLIPDHDYTYMKINNLSRWKYIQRLVQNFWKRWNFEYLSRLNQRTKWLKKSDEFNVGDIVLLKDENLPPSKWALARIVTKHPGPDNITRVYTVRCNGKVTERSVNKLCFLPIETRDIV